MTRSGLRRFLVVSTAVVLVAGCQQTLTPPAPPPVEVSSPPASGYEAVSPASSPETSYVFGWGDLPAALARPRGGTTRGSSVTLAPGRSTPLAAIAAAQDAFGRDRAAILAMAGDYKVSFHFMESLGFAPDHQPTRPYHSWATEHIRVIADTGRFISLQHTLVMFFANPDGTASEPMVTKHWRQDWTYEDTDLHTFRGNATWKRRRPTAAEAAGAWSQAVFQVDDSPRYEALGRWEHRGNLSLWTGENAWRPLPRREHTIRKDYDVMEGVHRIFLTPTGWLHEQNNWKRVAGESPSAGEPVRYVGQEIGLDRYERISAPSLVAADAQWQKTSGYWAIVRRIWAEIAAQREDFTIRAELDGEALFEAHFDYAAKLESGTPFDPVDAERSVRAILQKFVVQPMR